MLSLGLVILSLLLDRSYARLQHSPEDTYAFPKYRVNFLNNHPVSSDEAQQWLLLGLKNGVQEFMGSYRSQYENDWPQLDGAAPPAKSLEPKLKKMKLGPKRSYVCLIPPAFDAAPREYEEPAPVDPVKSWQLLQPLSGHCIYHRQGWFTYAYCHNSHVRQFREREHTHPHPAGGRIPQEDPEYQAYTLGKSPTSLRSKQTTEAEAQVAVPGDSHGTMNDLQLSEGAGQRYLTSKWTDGTVCDKTLRRREVEVQFHCSMTTTDQIQFLKETSVCKYLLVIHTPRLCGEPGFQSIREKQPAAPIHCREIMVPEEMATALEFQSTLPEAPFPYNSFARNPIHIPNPVSQQIKQARHKAAGLDRPDPGRAAAAKSNDALAKALRKLIGGDTKVKVADAARLDALDQLDADFHGDRAAFGEPIRGADGEELYVQVIDLEMGRQEGETQEELMARVREALAGQTKNVKKSKKPEEEEEEELSFRDEL